MEMKKARWILGVVLTVLAAFASVAVTQPGVAKAGDQSVSSEVKIDNFSFGPETLTVAAGTTVTWTNNDDVPHTVVSDDKTTFRSKALDTDDEVSYTFTKPGTYNYFCLVHPKMTAKVAVQ
jgi:plastocyanin